MVTSIRVPNIYLLSSDRGVKELTKRLYNLELGRFFEKAKVLGMEDLYNQSLSVEELEILS